MKIDYEKKYKKTRNEQYLESIFCVSVFAAIAAAFIDRSFTAGFLSAMMVFVVFFLESIEDKLCKLCEKHV